MTRNWERLKTKFFKSDLSLSLFLRKEIGKKAKVTEQTRGWATERKRYREEVETEARKKIKGELIKKDIMRLRVATKGELLALKAGLIKLEKGVVRDSEGVIVKVDLTGSDIRTLQEMFRLELGKPNTVSKNQVEVIPPKQILDNIEAEDIQLIEEVGQEIRK